MDTDVNDRNIMESIIEFGQTNIRKLIILMFYLGVVIIGYLSFMFGRSVSFANKYCKDIRDAQGMITGMESNNTILGVIFGFTIFMLLIVIWKVLCELILLIFTVLQAQIKIPVKK